MTTNLLLLCSQTLVFRSFLWLRHEKEFQYRYYSALSILNFATQCMPKSDKWLKKKPWIVNSPFFFIRIKKSILNLKSLRWSCESCANTQYFFRCRRKLLVLLIGWNCENFSKWRLQRKHAFGKMDRFQVNSTISLDSIPWKYTSLQNEACMWPSITQFFIF